MSDPDLALGGLEAIVRDLTSRFIEKGVAVTWLFVSDLDTHPEGGLAVEKIALRFPFKSVRLLKPVRKVALSIFALLHVLRNRERYSLIHINGDNGGLVTLLKGLTTVITLHGSSRESYRASLGVAHGPWTRTELWLGYLIPRALENIAVRRGTMIVTVSRSLAATYVQSLGRRDAVVIHPGVDTTYFRPAQDKQALRRALGLPLDVPLALWVGTTTFRKGLECAVRAVEATRTFHLVVVGSSPMVDSDRVHVLGWLPSRDRLRDAYSACDVAIVTSHYEGFSVSILEAMASGLAIVTRGDSPILEVADEQDLVVVDSDQAFSTSLSALEEDPTRMRALGLAARMQSETVSLNLMTDRYWNVFERASSSPLKTT